MPKANISDRMRRFVDELLSQPDCEKHKRMRLCLGCGRPVFAWFTKMRCRQAKFVECEHCGSPTRIVCDPQ